MATALYDRHADWYEQFVSGAAAEFTERVHAMLAELLGEGRGICLDVCCGTGYHTDVLRALGWTPVGVDLSAGQLGHAKQRLPVAVADAARLPVATGSVPVATSLLAHTDVPDYPALLAEVARALTPGGSFVHIGVHPCFVGAFADWAHRPQVVVDSGYADRSYRFDSWTPHGVRARVGAWHVPLAAMLNALAGAGFELQRVREAGPAGVPDLLGFRACRRGDPSPGSATPRAYAKTP